MDQLTFSFIDDIPPFRPGDLIKGRKNSRASQVLKRLFGVNRIILARECRKVNGEWTLFGCPVSEFKRLNKATTERLSEEVRKTRRTLFAVTNGYKRLQDADGGLCYERRRWKPDESPRKGWL